MNLPPFRQALALSMPAYASMPFEQDESSHNRNEEQVMGTKLVADGARNAFANEASEPKLQLASSHHSKAKSSEDLGLPMPDLVCPTGISHFIMRLSQWRCFPTSPEVKETPPSLY